MKLYLASFRFGKRPEELTKFAGAGTKVAVIANARDYQDFGHRAMRCAEEIAQLRELGFTADEVDLRSYFGKPAELEKKLRDCGLVWMSGGNVFVLRSALQQSGCDEILKRRIRDESLVYAGYSAAGCVLSPSLDAYTFVDDQRLVQKVYGLPAPMDGLGLLDYYLEPHYKSDHPESAAVDKEIAQLKAKKLSYLGLSDGEVLIIDGDGSSETVLS
jgi:dipeptidase E